MSVVSSFLDLYAYKGFRIIFELIKGEMAYVKDLENIELVCLLYLPLD